MWIDGYTLFGLLLLLVVGWVIYRSPILTWIFVLMLMLWVCFVAISAATFVTFVIHIPKGNYFAAAFSMALGIFLSAIPTLVTWEYLVRHIKEFRASLVLWD